jgi:hypothetical protein
MKVSRMKKVKSFVGEKQEVEVFEPFRPVTLCNIWGMEEVLADRCFTLILEKSFDKSKTRLVEDFQNDTKLVSLLSKFSSLMSFNVVLASLGDVFLKCNIYVK